jgi:transcriptional regulator with XRE-family HTH domain
MRAPVVASCCFLSVVATDAPQLPFKGGLDPTRGVEPVGHLPYMLRGNTQFSGDTAIEPVISGSLNQLRRDTFKVFGQPEPPEYESENNSHFHRLSRGNFVSARKNVAADVACRIQQLRLRLGMTQTSFAFSLGTRPSTVSKWESGHNRPSPDVFVRLAKIADGVDKAFFLEEAGLPHAFFNGERMASGLKESATQIVAKTLHSTTATLVTDHQVGRTATIPLIQNPAELGDPSALVECMLSFPAPWLPHDATVQAVQLSSQISPYIEGAVTAIVDISRRDPDRLNGCVVAARTPRGIEPMTLFKEGAVYLLVPLQKGSDERPRLLRPSGDWSVVGKVLKWIGDAPAGSEGTATQKRRLRVAERK